ncbi:MAG TPA: hypothetical protein VMV49_14985 [Candidatus Deferrimicrobium sp.]|nr:hypothetical protein [Candidatus Deferrimicrobium sp.]
MGTEFGSRLAAQIRPTASVTVPDRDAHCTNDKTCDLLQSLCPDGGGAKSHRLFPETAPIACVAYAPIRAHLITPCRIARGI